MLKYFNPDEIKNQQFPIKSKKGTDISPYLRQKVSQPNFLIGT